MGETPSFTFPFFSRLITIVLENVEYPWDVQTSMLLLLGFLIVVQVLFRVIQLFKITTQRSAPTTGTMATPTTMIGTVATQTLAICTAAEPAHTSISCPYTQKEMDMKVNLFSKG